MLNILKYIFTSILLLLASNVGYAQNTPIADTSAEEEIKPPENYGHQLGVSFDLAQLAYNQYMTYRTGYEFGVDYYIKHDLFLVAEGGWGSSKVTYSDLAYASNNNFFRIGVNRSLLERMHNKDWDMLYFGLRYGMAFINRSAANYVYTDSLWGNVASTVPAAQLNAYWFEVCAGMKVELYKGLALGYTIRGRFLMNTSIINELAPQYIAGYGRGDKASVFDFNCNLSYNIRWKVKAVRPPKS